jgi:hypothetical protein
VSPKELLSAAEQSLTSPVPGLGRLWPRPCALLIRLALEVSLDRYWARVLPAAATIGMQQLLMLPLYTSDEAASLAREAWLGAGGGASPHLRAGAKDSSRREAGPVTS